MKSTPPPPPVIGKSGNLTVFITPPAPAPEPETLLSEFSTPPTSPREAESPESPLSLAETDTPPPPVDWGSTPPLVTTVSQPLPRLKFSGPTPVQVPPPPILCPPPIQVPPLVKTVSPPLPSPKLSAPTPVQVPPPPLVRPPPVQVPPPQFDKASPGPDGSVLAFFWDAVARVQEVHASLDEHISRWFGLDQSKYQWALNDYYEKNTGKVMDFSKGSNMKELSSKMQKV